MKTMAMIAATMIATAGLGTVAQAQQTRPMLTGQEKAMRYQHDQQEKLWDAQRKQPRVMTESSTFGAPNRQSFGRADAENATETAPVLVVPGSGAALFSYNPDSKSWAYGY